jgi:hypothetical protein
VEFRVDGVSSSSNFMCCSDAPSCFFKKLPAFQRNVLRHSSDLKELTNLHDECRLLGCYAICSVLRLLVTANVHSSPILVTMIMEAISSSETSVLIRATRRNIPGNSIPHRPRRENLMYYIALIGWAL